MSFLGAMLAALCVTGCAQLDTTPAGNPDRVLAGTVNFNRVLPAGAEVVVKLIEPAPAAAVRPPNNDLGAASPVALPTDRVLGEYRGIMEAATPSPIPFQLEYHADDAALRRGVNIDVRISFGGKLRLRTVNAHVLTLAAAPFKQEVWVQPVQ